MPESIESQAILQFADVARVLVSQAHTDFAFDFASTAPGFLKLPQVAGEAIEV